MTERPVEPEEIGYLQDVEVMDDAEDVKTVRLIGDRGVCDVQITDESMVMLLETAEHVFDRIHTHMAELRDLFDEHREDEQ